MKWTKEKQREWRLKNIEQCKKYDKKYKEEHQEQVKINRKRWYINNWKKMVKAKEKYMFGGNREVVLNRDNYTCQNCGKTKEQVILCVHHIDGTGKNCKNKNNNLCNLITLCVSCHISHHRKQVEMLRRFKCQIMNSR